MEIGSFIEFEFQKGKERYAGEKNIARLNIGRAAIYHAARILGCNTVYIPLYQCKSVRKFLERKGISVKTYMQDFDYTPFIDDIEERACILLVNYFGIMSKKRMEKLASKYPRVIIDNSQGFFAEPLSNTLNVYSARKFVGVPDGAYVIGQNAEKWVDEYKKGYSSDTSLFLFQRIEYGCEGKTYATRIKNEERLNVEDIKKMSDLTRRILDGTDYDRIRKKRRENFEIASYLFQDINGIDPWKFYDITCVPMVYPFYLEDDKLLQRLLEGKHFQGHWWAYILDQSEEDTFEYKMSKYMIPITIDQRYGIEELQYIRGLV